MVEQKKPVGVAWTRTDWHAQSANTGTSVAELITAAFAPTDAGQGNIGLLLGETSGNLIDVDLDHPKTARLRDYFLPETAMRTGRAGRPSSHFWYVAAPGTLQGTRQHKMPDGAMCVEYRSNGGQSVIPPSIHPSGEDYRWEGKPWGGVDGPTVVDGRKLAVQVALLALGTVLIDGWPKQGSRHEAYLALAGGLLRNGDSIHPYWQKNAPVLIRALAYATLDDDGPDVREKEVMDSTLKRLRDGSLATGFGRLAELIGEDHAKQVRYLVGEVEAAAGLQPRSAPGVAPSGLDYEQARSAQESEATATPDEERDPLEERLGSWQSLDLEPYLTGQITPVRPTIFERSDGACLLYPGRINMLYGSSESAKSWLALYICLQEMTHGARAFYLDFEDEPVNTLDRLRLLTAAHTDENTDPSNRFPENLRHNHFTYIHPESAIANMQRGRGGDRQTTEGFSAQSLFEFELKDRDPTLIIVDGLSVLYGLHGLDTDKTMDTDIITGWLKTLTRNGRTTVLVIDHTGKTPEKGSLPIGSQHKVSMVMGTLLQVWVKEQPMPGKANGEVELVVLKDRPGQVRKISASGGGTGKVQVAAVVTIDSHNEHIVKISVDPKAASADKGTGTVTTDLRVSREAAAAMLKRRWEDSVVGLFHGDLDVTLSARAIFDLLPDDTTTNAHAKAALIRLENQQWIRRLNSKGEPDPEARRGAQYQLIVGDAGFRVIEPDDAPVDDEDPVAEGESDSA
jgi:hypothetical protein